MFGFGLLLVLTQLSASDVQTSAIVDGGHVHNWKLVELDDQSIVWFDDAPLPEFEIENDLYPVVLIRGLEIEDDRLTRSMDMKLAVDCERSLLAPLDAWFKEANEEAGRTESPRPIRFRSVERFPSELGKPVFDEACGPDAKNPFD